MPTAILYIIGFESNAGAQGAKNADATAGELAVRSEVQMFNNDTLVFENLDIGTNNLLGHLGLDGIGDPDFPGETYDETSHGAELQIANEVDAGRLPGVSQVYVVKIGQGGSRAYQWLDEENYDYWADAEARLNAAMTLLAGNRVRPAILSLFGINDRIAFTTESEFKADFTEMLNRIRAIVGSAPVIMDDLTAMDQHATMTETLGEFATEYSNAVTISSEGASLHDINHYDYAGMKLVASRMNAAVIEELGLMSQFADDTFTDADSTALTSHTGESGVQWVSSQGGTYAATITGNTVHASGEQLFRATAAPSGTDYSATGRYLFKSERAFDKYGVKVREQSGSASWYGFVRFAGGFHIYKNTNLIGLGPDATLSADESYDITLDVSGTDTVSLAGRVQRLSDGKWLGSDGNWSDVFVNAVTDTDDSSPINDAGFPGIWLGESIGNTTGMLLDSFEANEAGGTGSGGGFIGGGYGGLILGA